eukprot:360210-Chlamydomonas_euryale.AAC.21
MMNLATASRVTYNTGVAGRLRFHLSLLAYLIAPGLIHSPLGSKSSCDNRHAWLTLLLIPPRQLTLLPDSFDKPSARTGLATSCAGSVPRQRCCTAWTGQPRLLRLPYCRNKAWPGPA